MLEPHTTMLDPSTGALSPQREVTERRLADLDGLFAEPVPPDRRDELAYTVSLIPAPSDHAKQMTSSRQKARRLPDADTTRTPAL